ncbi:MAG: hypothetical protein ACI9CO_002054 [Candidatus Azotimanducaceae bacterium]|jgi:hypothetical protein
MHYTVASIPEHDENAGRLSKDIFYFEVIYPKRD